MQQLRMKRTLLISTGVVSLAVTLKLSLAVTLDTLTAEIPQLLSSFTALSWLQPPYLYLLVNCIIISIVASSKLSSGGGGGGGGVAVSAAEEFVAVVDAAAKEDAEVKKEEEVEEVVKEVVFGFVERNKDGVVESVDDDAVEKTVVISPEVVALPLEAVEVVEKPPYSARFGHRKSVKVSPQGKTALKKVSRPKRQETLESTWRTLTEGRSMPLTRHLRKADTFAGSSPVTASPPPARVMQKSDTFSGADGESPSPGSGKLRREPSLSQDDLNRRVEAFIKKFNEEMRLQRLQESMDNYRQPQFSYETVSR